MLATFLGRLPYYMAMKMQSIRNHHSERSTASSNNNRLLICCQAALFSLWQRLRQFFIDSTQIWIVTTILAVLIGVGIRVWLIMTNPVWSDEMYSIWAVDHSWQAILSGSVDVVHPPLYYLFLKAWMLLSDQLQWLRLSSLLASLGSMVCIYKLGQHESPDRDHRDLGQWWLMAYALSGFHLVFDWSVRMYALVTFLSLFTLLAVRKNWSPLLLALLVSCGLLLDYAYFWSLIPMWLLGFWQAWSDGHRKKVSTLIGLTIGTLPFMAWQIWRLPYFQAGLNGILWMNDLLYPSFFLPFFLGTHTSLWLTISTICYILGLLWLQRHKLNRYLLVWWIMGFALLLVESTYIFSLIKQPLLHVRSLQIVGLSVTLLWGIALTEPKFRWLGLGILCMTAIAVPHLFQHNALALLTEFYPWNVSKKVIISQYKQGDTLYISADPKSPSPLLYTGLLYSLDGKEVMGDAPTPYVIGTPPDSQTNCKKIWNVYAVVELCQ